MSDITVLLQRSRAGDREATEQLAPLVYDELKGRAEALMRREQNAHTLQATVLVTEAFMRLVDAANVDWESRTHFFALASKVMRRVLRRKESSPTSRSSSRNAAALKERVMERSPATAASPLTNSQSEPPCSPSAIRASPERTVTSSPCSSRSVPSASGTPARWRRRSRSVVWTVCLADSVIW